MNFHSEYDLNAGMLEYVKLFFFIQCISSVYSTNDSMYMQMWVDTLKLTFIDYQFFLKKPMKSSHEI